MKIYFASDHAGFDLKNVLVPFVLGLGYEVEDCGVHELDTDDDYPEIIAKTARYVQGAPDTNRAIILGGSGQGEAMVANRFPGVRAAVYYGGPSDIIRLSREHNDANVLSLGARFVSVEEAKEAVRAWLATDFSSEERHLRRVTQIETSMQI